MLWPNRTYEVLNQFSSKCNIFSLKNQGHKNDLFWIFFIPFPSMKRAFFEWLIPDFLILTWNFKQQNFWVPFAKIENKLPSVKWHQNTISPFHEGLDVQKNMQNDDFLQCLIYLEKKSLTFRSQWRNEYTFSCLFQKFSFSCRRCSIYVAFL